MLMIIGIGIDIIEILRIERAIENQPRFAERILTANELATFHKLHRKRAIEFLAGRFAAKEAFVKAVGTGISKKYSWHDIEVVKDSLGKPFLKVEVEAGVHISISHSKEYAVAQVILERLSS